MSRAFCYRCYRPQISCICDEIEAVNNQLNIIILQHPDEVKHPKGSAIIAKLGLANVESFVGEDFSGHEALNKKIEKEPDAIALVYPAKDALGLASLKAGQQPIKQLVFIDATWRKAKKIFLTSGNLHDLPSVRLPQQLISNYRIRKAPQDGYVSTVEAISYCLQQLEPSCGGEKLLTVFDRIIDRKMDFIPKP